MGRGQYKRWWTNCALGINEQADEVSRGQCSDLRNVWFNAGRVETRPGYWGVLAMPPRLDTVHSDNDGSFAYQGGIPVTFGGEGVGTTLYIALDSLTSGVLKYTPGAAPATINSNTDAEAYFHIWDGEQWIPVPIVEFSRSNNKNPGYLFGGADTDEEGFFIFPKPNLWVAAAAADVGATGLWVGDKYPLRITLRRGTLTGTTALNAAVDVIEASETFGAVLYIQWNSSKVLNMFSLDGYRWKMPQLSKTTSQALFNKTVSSITPYSGRANLRSAILKPFGEAYYSPAGTVFVQDENGTESVATVEDADYIVGAGAPYDKNFVAQLPAFPADVRHVLWADNRLWLLGDNWIRWSAGVGIVPAYKVFPNLSFEYLVESDNSPTTGLSTLGEHVIVYKSDSIWGMIPNGVNSFGLSSFTPARIVTGVGTVGINSLQIINNTHVFLSEEGIYRFNGAEVEDVTLDPRTGAYRLEQTLKSINPSRRQDAVSAHSKVHGLYLLAVSVNGSSHNNLVIVWDYRRNRWWLWDNIEAEAFIVDEDIHDNERIRFVNRYGEVFEMFKSNTDYGTAIDWYVITDEIGGEGVQRTLREIQVQADSLSEDIVVETLPDDADSGDSDAETRTLTFNTRHDTVYGSGVSGTDEYALHRTRSRKGFFREKCESHRVKVSGSTPARLFQVNIGELQHRIK